MNFSEEIKINRFNLPEECEKHSSLFLSISEESAEAKAEYEEKEEAADLIMSQADLFLRANWNESSWGKMTETSIKNRVVTSEEVRNAIEEKMAAKKKWLLLEAARTSFDHRKSMLNNLTSMLISGFYSTPEATQPQSRTYDKERELRRVRKERMKDDEE